MNNLISFFLCFLMWSGASSWTLSMDDSLSQLPVSESFVGQKKTETHRDFTPRYNIALERKKRIIDEDIQRVEGYINLISPHITPTELEGDIDIENYRAIIEELKELRLSINESMSEREIKQLTNRIQEKHCPEDANCM